LIGGVEVNKKYAVLLITLSIVGLLLLNSCAGDLSGGLSVELTMSSDSKSPVLITTDSSITFFIKLNQPISSVGSAQLVINPISIANSSEILLSTSRVDARTFKASFQTDVPGNYSFSAKFIQDGNKKVFTSKNTIEKYIEAGTVNGPKIKEITLKNVDARIIQEQDSTRVITAVVDPSQTPKVLFTVEATGMNFLTLGIFGENMEFVQNITNPEDMNIGLNIFNKEGIYNYTVMLYDGQVGETLKTFDTKKIKFIVTNDKIPPTIDTGDYKVINDSTINIESFSDTVPLRFGFKEPPSDGNIGLYKVKIDIDGKTAYEKTFPNGVSEDYPVVNLGLSKSVYSVNLYAEDLANKTTTKAYNINLKKIDIKASLIAKKVSLDQEIQASEQLEYGERIKFDCSVASDTVDLTDGATFTFVIKDDSNEGKEIFNMKQVNQRSVTYSNFMPPEGKNYFSLHTVVEKGGIKYYVTDQKVLNVQDVVAPELYKAVVTIGSTQTVIFDKDNPLNEKPIKESEIGFNPPLLTVFFRDRSKISYKPTVRVSIDDVPMSNFSIDNFDANLYRYVSYRGSISKTLVKQTYTFSIAGDAIEDSYGNFLCDVNKNPMPYKFSLTVE
jgi:hypothetical protein